MKKTIIILIAFFTHFTFAQVGIGTATPDQSATLDIYSDSKGIKLPTYDLVSLTDATSPIANPKEGLWIYNAGTNHPKGFYIWINDRWNNVITSSTVNKVLMLEAKPKGISTAPSVWESINRTNTYNTLRNLEFVSRNNSLVSLSSDTETITLPAGKYKITVGGDLGINTTNSQPPTFSSTPPSTGCCFYRSYYTYIKDTAGNILSPATFENRIWSQNYSSYNWVHYITLTNTTSLKIYWDTATDSNIDKMRQRTSISVAVYELK